MTLVAGVDSSTQSVKVVVCDAGTGEVRREGRASHPDGTEVDPGAWWDALQRAVSDAGGWDGVSAVSIAAQQHGMVCLDADDEVVRPALLWNDTRSAAAADDLVAELGAEAWAEATGSVPLASFTVTKLRWLADHEPELADRVVRVVLPHDWLTGRLAGRWVTDRGDASGTGYWGPAGWRPDLLERALRGRQATVPDLLGPAEAAGKHDGVVVGPGTGDNMGAALGLGLAPGDVAVSLGTSGTAFAVSDQPTADPSGVVAGFADATGRWLPLVCTLNCARVLDATADLLGVDSAGLDSLALQARPGSGGTVLLPYFDGERTPNLPQATGTLTGLTRSTWTRPDVARAAVEGVLCGLAAALDALRGVGVSVERALLIGGAARSSAVQALAPSILGVPVRAPHSAELVALGAARQAAWVLGAGDPPPDWPELPGRDLEEPQAWGAEVRAAHAEARHQLHGV